MREEDNKSFLFEREWSTCCCCSKLFSRSQLLLVLSRLQVLFEAIKPHNNNFCQLKAEPGIKLLLNLI